MDAVAALEALVDLDKIPSLFLSFSPDFCGPRPASLSSESPQDESVRAVLMLDR